MAMATFPFTPLLHHHHHHHHHHNPPFLPPPPPLLHSARTKSTTIASSFPPRRRDDPSYHQQINPNPIAAKNPNLTLNDLDLDLDLDRLDLSPHKFLQKGDPNTIQALIKEIIPVGLFLTLPTGREGYLRAEDLGFPGGLSVLQRLFRVGQEICVRIVCRGGGDREIVSMRKVEFAPHDEKKLVEKVRAHFEEERRFRENRLRQGGMKQ